MSQGDPVYFRPLPSIMSMFILRLPTLMSLLSIPYSPIGLYTSSLSSDSLFAFADFQRLPFRGQSNSVLDEIARSLSSSSLSYNNNDDDGDDDWNNELYRILIFRSLDSRDLRRFGQCRKIRCVVSADAKSRQSTRGDQKFYYTILILQYVIGKTRVYRTIWNDRIRDVRRLKLHPQYQSDGKSQEWVHADKNR